MLRLAYSPFDAFVLSRTIGVLNSAISNICHYIRLRYVAFNEQTVNFGLCERQLGKIGLYCLADRRARMIDITPNGFI